MKLKGDWNWEWYAGTNFMKMVTITIQTCVIVNSSKHERCNLVCYSRLITLVGVFFCAPLKLKGGRIGVACRQQLSVKGT
jgi:hypothetical protein